MFRYQVMKGDLVCTRPLTMSELSTRLKGIGCEATVFELERRGYNLKIIK